MCGFCGYINKEKYIDNDVIISKMNDTLIKRGPNEQNIYISKNVAFGHSRLSIIDVSNGTQPMKRVIDGKEYVIVYNGELYNTDDLRNNLIKKGYSFKTKCDTEVILVSYICYGYECLNFLNGIFAFAIYDKSKNEVFIARDRLGIKPLFFSKTNNEIIFSSEIKAILKHPEIKAILDKDGLKELLAIGPAHSPGKTFYKNIFEVEPGYFMKIKNFDINLIKYWDLETKPCDDTIDESILHIKDLVIDSCKRQLVSDVGICSMLSGGLDSSILTKIASDNIKNLTTFSINYTGNDIDFVANDYQLTKDSDYVKIMNEYLDINHINVEVDNNYLFTLLTPSLIARDMPGMADIDSSMYAFCNNISKNGFKVCLSGECSDEIFGGYPWFYREHLISHSGFPWALSENLRTEILKPGIIPDNNITEYILNQKNNTLKNVTHLDYDDKYQRRYRDINYLTIKWFMMTLVERTDRMSMANSLEVRVPFADHRIFEYVYNLPARYKLGINDFEKDMPVEKYLLRKAFEDELPNDVVWRKKSPFPKTYNKTYLKICEETLSKIISNSSSKILNIINKEYVENLINTHGKDLKENLFGQLMTYPQTLAYLIQIENWLKLYDINLDI